MSAAGAGCTRARCVFSVIGGEFLDPLESRVQAVRLQHHELPCDTQSLADRLLGIVRMVEYALDDSDVEARIVERHALALEDAVLDRAIALFPLRDLDRV